MEEGWARPEASPRREELSDGDCVTNIAEGHWDARGTLGIDREVPVGITDIAVTFELDTDADAATVQRLVEMSERFCVIYQTLRTPLLLSVTHSRVPAT
jgi:uncharacterized OsmC-like protein